MKIQSAIRPAITRPTATVARKADDRPTDSYAPSRLEGAVVGLAEGLKYGLLVDCVTLGAPCLFGYAMAGAQGAIVGGLIAPALLGTMHALNGITNPEKYV